MPSVAEVSNRTQKRKSNFLFTQLNRKKTLVLRDGTLFGRLEGDERYPYDDLMSSRHLLIHVEKSEIFIEDLGSTNGTKLNGKKIPPRNLIPLQNGDVVKVGNQRFKFRDLAVIRKKKSGRGRTSTSTADKILWALIIAGAGLAVVYYFDYASYFKEDFNRLLIFLKQNFPAIALPLKQLFNL